MSFAQTYGRLGWYELVNSGDEFAKQGSWFQTTWRRFAKLLRSDPVGMLFGEPVEWIYAHAHTIDWCLRAGRALRLAGKAQERACDDLSRALPNPIGIRATISGHQPLQGLTFGKVSPVQFVGGMLEDYLWINLKGVRRRVLYRRGRLQAIWGGNSLVESIYTIVTDSITQGRLAQCCSCGAVFVQTDERQRFCPPRPWQSKSTCMNRERVRRHRKKTKRRERKGK
jgi:hypothetical protein